MSTAPSVGVGVELGGQRPTRGSGLGEPVDRVDPDLGDGVGVRLGHRLDLDAALGRQHAEVLLGRTVEREAGVVLLGDVGGVLDPDDLDDVALDVEPEDVAGVLAHLVGVGGELDAAGLAAPADVHLGLDDHRVADRVGRGDRLVDRVDRRDRRRPGCRTWRRTACLGIREDPRRKPSQVADRRRTAGTTRQDRSPALRTGSAGGGGRGALGADRGGARRRDRRGAAVGRGVGAGRRAGRRARRRRSAGVQTCTRSTTKTSVVVRRRSRPLSCVAVGEVAAGSRAGDGRRASCRRCPGSSPG